MHRYVISFDAIDRKMTPLVGGKGANLGELSRIEAINVPRGFCITTEAFKKIFRGQAALKTKLDELTCVGSTNLSVIGDITARIRAIIESIPVPVDIAGEVLRALSNFEANTAFAIRSSATAEDLSTVSFAGQQDSYLNITGNAQILKHISKCWASLFTERAVIYRIKNGFDHRKVEMAVVVQEMVMPYAAGIMFTADPVTSNRKVVSIDASFGLGEALVSGLVNADNFKVCNGTITDKRIQAKKRGIYPSENGGTMEIDIIPGLPEQPSLSDQQVLSLERIGRTIEEHFGQPQDIEWCLVNDTFYIVQSRPITTLYPIPVSNDNDNHVYVSVGHQQMMTDAMKPLGLSFFLLTTKAHMRTAGGRLFVDVTPMLASAKGRRTIVDVLGKSDPLIRDALMNVLGREGFIKFLPDDDAEQATTSGRAAPLPDYETLKDYDPAVVGQLIRQNEQAIERLKQEIASKSGTELFDFILEDIQRLKDFSSASESFGVIMTGMNAASWVNEKMKEWLGEKSVADTLAQSAPNNITSEMGLALLDVADVIRPYPRVIDFLQNLKEGNFLDELVNFEGGPQVRDAIDAFLAKYGMRCAGEIDITRTRWSENPASLIPVILGNIRNFPPNEAKRRFDKGQYEALTKEKELLTRLQLLPGGEHKVKETKRMIGFIRNFSGYREYPKYGIVSRYFIYKQALLKEAEKLVQARVLRDKEDIFFLAFDEFREVVRTRKAEYRVIDERKEEYKIFERLTPPRIITSDGEIVTGKYKREDLPAGAIAGLPVSAGVIEGRARVIARMEDANLQAGDILVTAYTDPSWTPLFVSIKGLVTEVGGLMTHGAVIAREYGLPAVVGVEDATRLIRDGQKIRVNGTDGYIELL